MIHYVVAYWCCWIVVITLIVFGATMNGSNEIVRGRERERERKIRLFSHFGKIAKLLWVGNQISPAFIFTIQDTDLLTLAKLLPRKIAKKTTSLPSEKLIKRCKGIIAINIKHGFFCQTFVSRLCKQRTRDKPKCKHFCDTFDLTFVRSTAVTFRNVRGGTECDVSFFFLWDFKVGFLIDDLFNFKKNTTCRCISSFAQTWHSVIELLLGKIFEVIRIRFYVN